MAGVSGGRLAAEVVQSGGFGFIAAGHTTYSHLLKELNEARKLLNAPAGRLRAIGVGFLLWRLERLMKTEEAERLISLACSQTSAIWLAFAHDLHRWVDCVRRLAGTDVKIVVLVTSVEQAMEAARLGADVLVVQGSEAGGHGSAHGQPLFELFPSVARAIDEAASSSLSPCGPGNAAAPLLLAAGGLVTPAQVKAALALPSCDGVVLGTALTATSASLYSPSQKQAIVQARTTGPRTLHFDRMRGTLGWPDWVNGRALENASSKGELDGVAEEELRQSYAKAVETGDADRIVTWAGTSVGDVTDEPSVAVIIGNIERQLHSPSDALSKL